MPLHLRPVGPLPESVYWRRRAGVLAVLVLLLALLSTCGGEAPQTDALVQAPATPAASPATSPSAPVTTPLPSAAVAPCPDAALRVDASPQRQRYRRGERPVLRLAVRNAGAVPCTRELGQGAVELLVFSGADRIWSSDDCAPGGQPGPVVLRPQQLQVVTLTWSGRRSRPGCPDRAEAIEPGTYRVLGRAGALQAEESSFLVV